MTADEICQVLIRANDPPPRPPKESRVKRLLTWLIVDMMKDSPRERTLKQPETADQTEPVTAEQAVEEIGLMLSGLRDVPPKVAVGLVVALLARYQQLRPDTIQSGWRP